MDNEDSKSTNEQTKIGKQKEIKIITPFTGTPFENKITPN